MSKQYESFEMKLDVIVPESEYGYLVEEGEIKATAIITRDIAATIFQMVEALINVDGRQMASAPFEGAVQWPVAELSEALGQELDERDFPFATVSVQKTTFAFCIRNSQLGSVETVEMDVLELSRHFGIAVPWMSDGKAWREDAACWFRDLINTGTDDIEAEADVAKAIVETLVGTAPSSVVVAALAEWAARAEKNEDQTFDCVFALPGKEEGEDSLLERATEILSGFHGSKQAVN